MDSFFKSETFGPFVDGSFHTQGQKPNPHYSIALGKPWKKLVPTNPDLMESALSTCEHALEKSSTYQRADILQKMAGLLKKHRQIFATCITMEMGKTLRDSLGEVAYAANYLEWFAEEAKRVLGYTIPSRENKHIEVFYQPIGPVAVITPWNFPIAMAARKIGPAIAAGCSSLVKPSSDTPLTMLLFAEIANQAGLPPGALAILPGDAEELSQILLEDSRVKKLTFTGSTEVGIKLYKQCAPTLKKITMELGGHAPVIVFDDADLDRAVQETINAKLRVSGQTCVCANRIYVQSSMFTAYVEKLTQAVQALKKGNPLEKSTDLTDTLHPTSEKKVPEHIADALKKGAQCLLKGNAPSDPVILSGITQEMRIFSEETFGPVFPLISFETEEEVISSANDTVYGLASYLFTSDLNRAYRVSQKLDYGIIGLNDGLPSSPEIPFGGIKHSGFGREGGPRGIYEYLIEKAVSLKY